MHCCCCRVVREGLRRRSPAGGSRALVTKQATNFEVSFIVRTAREQALSKQILLPEGLGYLPSWREMVLCLLGEATAREFTVQNNVCVGGGCYFFSFLLQIEILDCSGEHSQLNTKGNCCLLINYCIFGSIHISWQRIHFFFSFSKLLAKRVRNLLCLWSCIAK